MNDFASRVWDAANSFADRAVTPALTDLGELVSRIFLVGIDPAVLISMNAMGIGLLGAAVTLRGYGFGEFSTSDSPPDQIALQELYRTKFFADSVVSSATVLGMFCWLSSLGMVVDRVARAKGFALQMPPGPWRC